MRQNQYGATHTRAISDKNSPIHGKGSGQFLDIYNYGVGGDWDKTVTKQFLLVLVETKK
jgi:hypothetical protein